MNKKSVYKHYLIFVLIVLFSFNISAQKDTVSFDLGINLDTRPLQLDSDFLKNPSFIFDDSNLLLIQPTQFTKDYTFKYLTYDPVKDPKRLLYNTGLYTGAAVLAFGTLWVLPESFTNWDKDEILEAGFFSKWKENVKAGPVWDEDDFFLNWVMHPYSGGVYYMSARGSGYNKWESFAYSAIMSTFFWEFGIEAFAEIPSWQDLFITPILGSLVGEQFFKWKGKIIRNDSKVLNSKFLGGTSLLLIDPFNQIIDGFGYKTKNKVQTYSAFAPIDYDFYTNKTIWGMQVVMIF